MGRATITHDGDAVIFTMPRNVLMLVALVAAIGIAVALALFVLRADGGEASLWTWFLPALVAAALLPAIANAGVTQQVRIDPDGISTVRWFGRRHIDWSDAIETIGYTYGQDLYLRIRDRRGRILISTRYLGWDAEEMRAMARSIDAMVDAPKSALRGPGTEFASLAATRGKREKGKRQKGGTVG